MTRDGEEKVETVSVPLNAAVCEYADGWTEVTLDGLDVVIDGMLPEKWNEDMAYALTAEYHLARKYGNVPFANLRRNAYRSGRMRPTKLLVTLTSEVAAALAALEGKHEHLHRDPDA